MKKYVKYIVIGLVLFAIIGFFFWITEKSLDDPPKDQDSKTGKEKILEFHTDTTLHRGRIYAIKTHKLNVKYNTVDTTKIKCVELKFLNNKWVSADEDIVTSVGSTSYAKIKCNHSGHEKIEFMIWSK